MAVTPLFYSIVYVELVSTFRINVILFIIDGLYSILFPPSIYLSIYLFIYWMIDL